MPACAELEFFVFDNVQFDQRGHEAFYQVDSVEGVWNRGRQESPNLGYKPGSGLGYFPCPPTDSLVNLRTEMAQRMAGCGVATAAHFHEVATGGQCEIDLVSKPLLESADQVMLARYIIRNVARRAGKTATFMPKPLFGDNGSGMHTHLSVWKDNQPLLAGHGYAGLSDLGLYAIGGLIKHALATCAFANPTTNSYKRLVAGFEAPTKISYSRRNRAAIIRIPVNSPNPHSRRIEYRCPDSAANPYLLFSAMLMAVLDGIQNKLRRASRSTRTFTTFSLWSWIRSRQPRGRWRPRLTLCGPTTNSCSGATSSPRTSLTPGSGTSRSTRSTRSGPGPIRTSFRSITMYEHGSQAGCAARLTRRRFLGPPVSGVRPRPNRAPPDAMRRAPA